MQENIVQMTETFRIVQFFESNRRELLQTSELYNIVTLEEEVVKS